MKKPFIVTITRVLPVVADDEDDARFIAEENLLMCGDEDADQLDAL